MAAGRKRRNRKWWQCSLLLKPWGIKTWDFQTHWRFSKSLDRRPKLCQSQDKACTWTLENISGKKTYVTTGCRYDCPILFGNRRKIYGLRSSDVRQLALQLVLKNKLEHPFPVDKGMASRKWWRNVRVHNSCLSLQRPESLSLGRAKYFNNENVTVFFHLPRP